MCRWPVPVSYTHLDVYKRQMRDGAECETEIVLPVELIKRESTGEL